MKLQDQLYGWEDLTNEKLGFFRQIGVDYVVAPSPPSVKAGEDPTRDLEEAKALIDSFGMELHVVQMAERIWEGLQYGRMTRSEIYRLFHCNRSSEELDAALGLLEDRGKVVAEVRRSNSGRYVTQYGRAGQEMLSP